MNLQSGMPANVAPDHVGGGWAVVGSRGVGFEGAETAARRCAPLGALRVVMVDGVVRIGEVGGAVHARCRALLEDAYFAGFRRCRVQVVLLEGDRRVGAHAHAHDLILDEEHLAALQYGKKINTRMPKKACHRLRDERNTLLISNIKLCCFLKVQLLLQCQQKVVLEYLDQRDYCAYSIGNSQFNPKMHLGPPSICCFQLTERSPICNFQVILYLFVQVLPEVILRDDGEGGGARSG